MAEQSTTPTIEEIQERQEVNRSIEHILRPTEKEFNQALNDIDFLLTKIRQMKTEATTTTRALERIADGDIDCNCTHRDEFCCVKQRHYCPFCIAVVALQSRDERPQQLPASTDERQKQHEDSYWDDPLRGNFKC